MRTNFGLRGNRAMLEVAGQVVEDAQSVHIALRIHMTRF
jgi:hypothetical protein